MQDLGSSSTDRREYIVGLAPGSAISLTEIVRVLNATPQAKVVAVQGPQDNPSLVVALLTPENAQQLRDQYRGQIIVEENYPLKQFY